MKVKTIEVRVAEKVNVGNFETIDPAITLVGELEEGDSLDAAYNDLAAMAEELWVKQAKTRIRFVLSRCTDEERIAKLKDLYKAFNQ